MPGHSLSEEHSVLPLPTDRRENQACVPQARQYVRKFRLQNYGS